MQYRTGKQRDIPLFPSARRLFRPFLEVEQLFTIPARSRDTRTRELIKQLMLKNLKFHDARATALTHMAKRVDVMTLAKISGHADIQTLYDRYYRESAADIAARLKG
jgi:integrase